MEFFLSAGYWQGVASGITILLVPFLFKQYVLPLINQALNNTPHPLSGNWRESPLEDPDKNRKIETFIEIDEPRDSSTISGKFTRKIISDEGDILETHGNLVGRYTNGYFYGFINEDHGDIGYAVFLLHKRANAFVGRDCWYDEESDVIKSSGKDIVWERTVAR